MKRILFIAFSLMLPIAVTEIDNSASDAQKVPKAVPKRLKELEEIVAIQKQTLEKQEETIDKLDAFIDKLGKNVAYEIRLNANTAFKDQEVLKFDDVYYNEGDGYNLDTGKFTAPVSGTYILWSHVMQMDYSMLDVTINTKNGPLIRTYVAATSQFGVASGSLVTHLEEGDEVWLEKLWANRATSMRGDSYSSHGGALLKASLD